MNPKNYKALGHLIDAIIFRTSGFLLLYNEARLEKDADWEIIVAAICLFFMPDAIRGKNSLPFRVIEKLIGIEDDSKK